MPRTDGTTVYSLEGTLAHEVLAWALTNPHQDFTEHYPVGYEMRHGVLLAHVDDEMHRMVQRCVDYVGLFLPGAMLVEVKARFPVTYSASGKVYEVGGTADIILKQGTTLHVMDLKYGKGVKVYAEDNTQLMCYGAGALHQMGFLYEDIQDVCLHILQPRLDHWDDWAISTSALEDWVTTAVAPAVAQGLRVATAFYTPSEKACQWCPLVGDCQAARDHVVHAFDNLEAQDLDRSILADLLGELPLFRIVAKAAEAKALQLILAGEPVGDWRAVEGRSDRAWVPNEDLPWTDEHLDGVRLLYHTDFCEEHGVDPYADPKLKSPAAVEKELGEAEFKRVGFPERVTKPKGKPVLAPAHDKRPDYVSATPSDFDIIEDES